MKRSHTPASEPPHNPVESVTTNMPITEASADSTDSIRLLEHLLDVLQQHTHSQQVHQAEFTTNELAPSDPSRDGQSIPLQALAESVAAAIDSVRVASLTNDQMRAQIQQLEVANADLQAQVRANVALRKQLEAQLHRLSLTDELTGLSNRRGFLLIANQQLKLAHRVKTHGWLIYIYLDGLTQINEKHGSEAGDWLISNAAKVFRESFRDSDVLARVGDYEFVIFATSSSTPIEEIQERLLANIAHHNRCFSEQPTLAISVGIVRCDPRALHSLDDMIHQADAAMYIEKRRKRARLQDEFAG